ncbi:MAG: LysR family transcriptional regulator [Pseudomonadota bacterium]
MADRIEAWDLFLKVAEFGSFSEAARRAGISPGQASKMISALEDQIGVRLFERTTRAVRLTLEGEGRLDPARNLVEAAGRLIAPTTPDEAMLGTIRISAPIIYGARILSPLLTVFMARHPGLNVRLNLTDRRIDLINDGLDLALRIGTLSDTSLMGRKLSSVHLQPLAAAALLDQHQMPQEPADLASCPCIIDLNLAEPRRWSFLKAGAEETVRVNGRFETDSAEAALQATRAGLGVGLIPDFCLAGEQPDGLMPILETWTVPTRDVWLLWPSGRHLVPRTRALVDYLAKALPKVQAEDLDACLSSKD